MARLAGLLRGRLAVGPNVGRLLGQGAWAGLDQTLFAFSNFVLNVLLARWLEPAAYGAFTVAYAAFLLVGTAHSALLTEPMLVFGAGKYRDLASSYLAVLLRLHWRGTLVAAGVAAVLTYAYRWWSGAGFASVVLVLAVVSPAILFQWLLRRSTYMRFEPRDAAIAGAMYLPLVIGAALTLSRLGWLSPVTALAAMGAASMVSGGWLWLRSGARTASVASDLAPSVVREHWSYGRWALAASLLSWVPANVYYLLLPIWGGLEATAAVRAVTNLVLPILHLNSALGAILLPTFVRAREAGTLRRMAVTVTAAFLLTSALYYVVVVVVRVPLLHWLFDGQYDAHANLVAILGLLPMTAAVTAVAGDVLRARERPDRVFLAYVVATVVALTAGTAAVAWWSVRGAAFGLVMSSLVTGLAMLAFVRGRPGRGAAAVKPGGDGSA